jgi:hypothetical protein
LYFVDSLSELLCPTIETVDRVAAGYAIERVPFSSEFSALVHCRGSDHYYTSEVLIAQPLGNGRIVGLDLKRGSLQSGEVVDNLGGIDVFLRQV